MPKSPRIISMLMSKRSPTPVPSARSEESGAFQLRTGAVGIFFEKPHVAGVEKYSSVERP